MAEENEKNGKVGLVERVTTGIKEDVSSLKTDIPVKVKEQVEGLKDPTKTQVFTSIFRHKHDDTPRNRALGVLSNVFLHLHPAKINRDAVRYSYTWGMGGITFYLFIVLTFTGVLLMFYYHPSKVQAFRDVLYLEHDVPFGKILRNMPTFSLSDNELRKLVRFFVALQQQPLPYIPEQVPMLTAKENDMARSLFSSTAAPWCIVTKIA